MYLSNNVVVHATNEQKCKKNKDNRAVTRNKITVTKPVGGGPTTSYTYTNVKIVYSTYTYPTLIYFLEQPVIES